MIETKTTSDCTIYAFVGTAILAISLVVAMYVGKDFHPLSNTHLTLTTILRV